MFLEFDTQQVLVTLIAATVCDIMRLLPLYIKFQSNQLSNYNKCILFTLFINSVPAFFTFLIQVDPKVFLNISKLNKFK